MELKFEGVNNLSVGDDIYFFHMYGCTDMDKHETGGAIYLFW